MSLQTFVNILQMNDGLFTWQKVSRVNIHIQKMHIMHMHPNVVGFMTNVHITLS